MRKVACKTLSFILLAFASVMLLPTTTYAAPDPLKCDQATEIGQQRFDAATNEFYVCRDNLVGWEAFNDIGPAAGAGGGFIDGQIDYSTCVNGTVSSQVLGYSICPVDYMVTSKSCQGFPCNITMGVGTEANRWAVASSIADTPLTLCCRYKNHP